MIKIHHLDELKSSLNEKQISLVYISRQNCSVCHGLLPQVEQLLKDYPSITSFHVDADEIPEIAGEYSIFTVPVVLVFVDGKEMIRKGRFIPIDELNAELSRLVNLIND